MTIQQARQITLHELKKCGYSFKEIQSKSTNSLYFRIESSKESLLFRISDHQTYKDVCTFRIDHKTNDNKLKNFIKNRVYDLSYRNTKKILGI